MKKKWLVALLWLQVIAVAAMIFWFSAQDGETSMETSGGIVDFLLHLLVPDFDGRTYEEKAAIIDQFQFFMRKAAHFTEFAVLGESLRLLFHALCLRRPMLWAWVTGTLYACTDELHQMLGGTRTASWEDVCIDSAGVLTAVLVTTLWLWLREKRRKRQHKEKNGHT